MFKYLFIAIIAFIILYQFVDNFKTDNNNQRKQVSFSNDINYFENTSQQSQMKTSEIKELSPVAPWTRVVVDESNEYPFKFHTKIMIPSLNDFENWKNIIPNLEFSPISKELIIPSKDEASALAILNLINMNFNGEMSIDDILKKQLIQISITQAQKSQDVAETIRDQIINSLNKKPQSIKVEIKGNDKNPLIDIKSDNFKDTFQHFDDSNNNKKTNDFEAYDGNDYSYI